MDGDSVTCGLCQHEMLPSCGSAGVTDGDNWVWLCNGPHSCFEAWTVHGERPNGMRMPRPVGFLSPPMFSEVGV